MSVDISKVIISSSEWRIQDLVDRIDSGHLRLDQRHLRRHEVWTTAARSRFVESLLLGFPVAQILLAVDPSDKHRYTVIDGDMRLGAISDFYNGDFVLTDLEFRTDLLGYTYGRMADADNSQYWDECKALNGALLRVVRVQNWQTPDLLVSLRDRANIQ